MNKDVLSFLLYFFVSAPQVLAVFLSQLAAQKEPQEKLIFTGISTVVIPAIMFLNAWIIPEIMSLAIEEGGFGHSSPLSCRFFLIILVIGSSCFKQLNVSSR